MGVAAGVKWDVWGHLVEGWRTATNRYGEAETWLERRDRKRDHDTRSQSRMLVFTPAEQFRSGRQQGEGSQVHLSVINMNEQKGNTWMVLWCSVLSYDKCEHTVKWLYEGKDVDKDNEDLQTSQTGCQTTVFFLTFHHIYTSRLNLFTCEVTDGHTGKVQLIPFSLQSSARTGCSALNYIMLVMRVAELVLITVITVLLIRAAGKQRPPDDNTVSVRSRTVKRSGAATSQEVNHVIVTDASWDWTQCKRETKFESDHSLFVTALDRLNEREKTKLRNSKSEFSELFESKDKEIIVTLTVNRTDIFLRLIRDRVAGGSSLSRDAQTSLTPDTSSSSSGGIPRFPGQLRDIVSPACPGSSSEASSRWDMPGTPP
ncbi:hypothetical protein L3Q82_011338 [Scortum barcoo]|uniref:Uncharacterized protein n=1 Tax=Scortum barcoo TaxID=214431 RepID=A0ACB8W9J1_9TELE|nr:hypothetical protein L3Q82_011338 [Scortum barcoo]